MRTLKKGIETARKQGFVSFEDIRPNEMGETPLEREFRLALKDERLNTEESAAYDDPNDSDYEDSAVKEGVNKRSLTSTKKNGRKQKKKSR